MDDRITEIRPDYEAAAQLNNWTRANSNLVHRIVDAAIGDRLLVDPDTLTIRRNENGKWPISYIWSDDAVDVITHYLDALASSEGVEPPKVYGSDFINRCHICGRDAGHSVMCSVS